MNYFTQTFKKQLNGIKRFQLAAGLILTLHSGCGSNPETPKKPVSESHDSIAGPAGELSKPSESKDQSEKSYKLVGVIRKIDKESGEVMIRHEEIPGFMKAMTMPFNLKGQDVLNELIPGDEIEGKLIVSGEDIELEEVVVTYPAPPSAIKFGPNGVEVQAKPLLLLPGEAVPDFRFIRQDGKPGSLKELRGKTVVLTFIYTRCPLPNFCPLMDRKFGELAARLENTARADQVRLLSVSFDPENDTPEVLTTHAKSRGAKMPLWTFAVASHEDLAQFGPQVGLMYGPGEKEIMHNLSTVVIGPDGSLVRLDTGPEGGKWSNEEMLATIVKATGMKQ